MNNKTSGNHTKLVNCYSGGEGPLMAWSQNLRGEWLGPLLRLLGRNGITAGHITLLSLLCGLLFCPLFVGELYPLAFLFLLLHVLLDGIDGPLARHLGRDGDRGSFTDTAADQLVVTATTITLVYTGVCGAWSGGWYLFLYTVVVAFAFVRNALAKPYSWLFRPRFIVFLWLPVEVYWWPGSLEFVLWIATFLLAVKTVTGFIAIRNRI